MASKERFTAKGRAEMVETEDIAERYEAFELNLLVNELSHQLPVSLITSSLEDVDGNYAKMLCLFNTSETCVLRATFRPLDHIKQLSDFISLILLLKIQHINIISISTSLEYPLPAATSFSRS
jgi:hypothetical protein